MVHGLNKYNILEKAIRISNSTVDVERRLKNLMELFQREMGLDVALLFNLDREAGSLHLRISSASNVPPDVSVRLTGNFMGRAALHRQSQVVEPSETGNLPDECERLFRGYATLAAFPVMDDQILYGVVVLLNQEPVSYSLDRITLVETIGLEMAGTIRNSRLYAESKKRIAELSVLYEMGRAVSSTLELDQVLDTVVNITSKVLLAEGCALNVMDAKTRRLRVAASYGSIPESCRVKHLLDAPAEDLTTDAFGCLNRERPYVGRASQDPACPSMRQQGEDRSLACVPLRFKGAYRGTLCIYNKTAAPPGRSKEFDREDMELLITMGTMISSSLENALTFQTVNELARSNELLVKGLTSLYEISSAMMTTFKMDELLQIIAKALTFGRGLGFDRALVLVMDEERDILRGAAMREVYPEDRHESSRSFDQALAQIQNSVEEHPALQDFLNLEIPLQGGNGVFERTVTENRSFNVREGDPEAEIESALPVPFGHYQFVTVPMKAKGKVVGVLAADRDFSQREISAEDVRYLSMLANQAGLAIENSRLYEYIDQAKKQLTQTRERLIESEKLAALGEMAAGMAHEIRNPLVSIGGFTRRLLKSMPEDSSQRVYVQVIINEVARLEKTLSEVLDFSSDSMGQVAEYDLNAVIEEALYIFKREFEEGAIEVAKDLADLPTVLVDERQIKHVFFNLFYNACQAMDRGGGLRIRTYPVKIDDRAFVACEISDTGPGIPADVLPHIFNPFFTTKADGTGLGLSIVHKIMDRHNGQIDVVNRQGKGASFTLRLPVAEEAGLYLK